MKILVIQLTRLGDILCTLPALRALRRENPEAEIHFLVRKRFASAARLAAVDHLWQFDTQQVLGGLITEAENIPQAMLRVNSLIISLRSEKFDRIINLSFSPSSSFITHLVSQGQVPTFGYTRTSDLFLSVPDQASQYFRAQVGLEKSNRLHVIDLLGWIAGVQIQRRDIYDEANGKVRSGIICHLGASQKDKAWPEISWTAFLQRLSVEQTEPITLVGGAEERALAENILLQVGSEKIQNKVGETSWAELVHTLSETKLYIGADSGPLHAASLAGCVTLNLSLGNVRFWETGPVTTGSRVLVSRAPGGVMSDFAVTHALEMLTGENSTGGAYICSGHEGVRYRALGAVATPVNLFDAWSMVEWMYFEGEKPMMGGDLPTICAQAAEAATLALQQLDVLEAHPQNREVAGILDQLDEVIDLFGKNIKPLGPLVDFFKSQKENISPGPREQILSETRRCYSTLHQSLSALKPEERV